MKRLILIIMIMVSFSFSYGEENYSADKGIMETILGSIGLKKDYSENFEIDDIKVSSRKRGYRSIQGEIKNIGNENYELVTFLVLLGDTESNMTQVHSFTLFNVKAGRKYDFNFKVNVGDIKGKKVKIEYVRGKAE